MTWHSALPWDAIRAAYRRGRAALFSRPRPSGAYLRVAVGVESLVEGLGGQSYAPNWEQSYHKRGEDVNLARVFYEVDEVDGRTFKWWQTHVRGWQAAPGVLDLQAHHELEPTENAREHILGVGYDRTRGMHALRGALGTAGISYDPIRWSSENGVSRPETDGGRTFETQPERCPECDSPLVNGECILAECPGPE